MSKLPKRADKKPGIVRDAICEVLKTSVTPLSSSEIAKSVEDLIGITSPSSVRSYLQKNVGETFLRQERGKYSLKKSAQFSFRQKQLFPSSSDTFSIGKSKIVRADCLDWLENAAPNSIHAVVTDPPYGLVEYSPKELEKLKEKSGGVWRQPPSFDGNKRSPLPRFTTLTPKDLNRLSEFFNIWSKLLTRVLVPGANVVVAANPLVSHIISNALAKGGLERRGEIVRLVRTMRGGDRPKAAHEEFSDVSVMPRSMWEPWLTFRKPIEGRVQDNLRKWKTGGFRRISEARPFGDVIDSAPTRASERRIAPHPSLKPQGFLRQLVRGVLPLGEGIILDPFCGGGSTLAAANHLDYKSLGLEISPDYFEIAKQSIGQLEKI